MTYGGVDVYIYFFFGLCTSFRRAVSFTPLPLYLRERASGTFWTGWVGPRASMVDVEKGKQ
jgi:hypothetical protein